MLKKINIWYLSSFLISIVVAVPILTVFSSFFESTGNYSYIIKDTFLYEYIFNSLFLLLGVLLFSFVIGVGCAYLVSFYNFLGSNFFKWALILSFAVPSYIYAYSLTAFFENYGTAFTILKNIFGEGDNNSSIPKYSLKPSSKLKPVLYVSKIKYKSIVANISIGNIEVTNILQIFA